VEATPLIYREVGVVDPVSQNNCGIGFSDPRRSMGHGYSGHGVLLVPVASCLTRHMRLCLLQRSLHWATGTKETGICSAKERDGVVPSVALPRPHHIPLMASASMARSTVTPVRVMEP
jgi:hypothetical protein